jgi:hypothetical protein
LSLLIAADAFRASGANGEPAGPANGRALAYLAHQFLGDGFGTVYDLSTIAIRWFAGASAMAGLLNIVPRYLPRYGMAPEWTRATRPLVLIYTAIGFALTLLFRADVDAQGGAYATGVLVLMTSAAVAVTLSVWRGAHLVRGVCFVLVTLLFVYTTLANVIERPDGLKIGAFFIAAIVLSSLVSRVWRTTELRVEKITLDSEAQRFKTKWMLRANCGSSPTNRAGAMTLNIVAANMINARIITSLRMSRLSFWRSTCVMRAIFPPT